MHNQDTSINLNKRTLHIKPLPEEFGVTLKKAPAQKKTVDTSRKKPVRASTGTDAGNTAGRNIDSSAAGGHAGSSAADPFATGKAGRNAAGGSAKPVKKKMSFGRLVVLLFVCGIAYFVGKTVASEFLTGPAKTINTQSVDYDDSDDTEAISLDQSDTDPAASAEAVREYFAAMGSVDLSQTGSMTAEAGSDLYITNLVQGKILGSTQEMTVIPWHDSWESDENRPRIRHDVSELEITFHINDKYASCTYSYDYEAAASMYERYTQSSSRELTELEQREIDGVVYQVFHEQIDSLTYAYAMRDLDTEGKFSCYVVTNRDSGIDMDEFLEDAVSGLQSVHDSFENITAASPVAARTLMHQNGAHKVIVQSDIVRHAALWKISDHITGYGNYGNGLYWDTDKTYGGLSYHHSFELAASNDLSTEEEIDYDFERGSLSEFKEESTKTYYSDASVSNLKKGKLQKYSINGYPVYARFLQFNYKPGDISHHMEIISIGVQISDDTYLFIQETIDDPAESYQDHVESTIVRLAGENLQIIS